MCEYDYVHFLLDPFLVLAHFVGGSEILGWGK